MAEGSEMNSVAKDRDAWREVARKSADEVIWLRLQVKDLLAFYEEMDGIIAESHGVAGWHLNGDVASWGEFSDLIAASNTVQTRQCDHVWSDPSIDAPPVTCTKCGTSKVILADSAQEKTCAG